MDVHAYSHVQSYGAYFDKSLRATFSLSVWCPKGAQRAMSWLSSSASWSMLHALLAVLVGAQYTVRSMLHALLAMFREAQYTVWSMLHALLEVLIGAKQTVCGKVQSV